MPYYETNLLTKTLDALGLGASKFVEVKLEHTTINAVISSLSTLANYDNWKQVRDERSENLVIQDYDLGGFSVSGYQKLTVVLTQAGVDVKVSLTSKSRGGQLADWGANAYNVQRVYEYITHPDMQLTTRKVPGESKGFVLMLIVFIVGFVLYVLIDSLISPSRSIFR